MEDDKFYKLFLEKILLAFPEFNKYMIINEKNNSVAIKYPDNNKCNELYISYNKGVILIGLSSWHTHPSLYGSKTPEEQINKAIYLINGLISGNFKIWFSGNISWITENSDEENIFSKGKKVDKVFIWNKY